MDMTKGFAKHVDNLWDASQAAGLDDLGKLAYRSNLFGRDRSVANYGGGNTSAKVIERDHAGRERRVMYVKGSGSDLATITRDGFTGLRMDEIDPLFEREKMSDEDMVAYLALCQTAPTMPRSSIETLLHAFVPFDHVDHTHPDATNMICCAVNGEQLAKDCYGDDAVWIPYIRPGFTLAKQVGEAVRNSPHAKLILLAKHGLVTWGNQQEESYEATIDAINRAVDFVNQRTRDREPIGGPIRVPVDEVRRAELLSEGLLALRGEVSQETPKVLQANTSDAVLEFVCGRESSEVSQVGAACPDHLIHTKVVPLWVDFDPGSEGPQELAAKLVEGARRYRDDYRAYFDRHQLVDEDMFDPNPRVVLVPGVGMITIGKDLKAARLSRDLYHRAIEVMRGAAGIDEFISLTEEESYAVEYWPLELYKLSLAPASAELAGRVALVTGGGGGIGSAVARAFTEAGALVVVTDLDAAAAGTVAEELGSGARAVAMDVTDEDAVAAGFKDAVLAHGGIDVVVSNAGVASSAPIEDTSLDLWERDHRVLARGYFLVAREAFRAMKRQGSGGSIVFVASKNSLVAGKNAAAYSSAKAAELHLARCLAEEGGRSRIRVNTVNPDAVLQGSRIWAGAWREERARAYGIEPDELEEHYRQRTTLKVNVLPEDIAEAVLFFASEARAAKSTGNILNVDGGVAAAYPR
jgi:rhamnulose-1-phosphate aldolase/alcohol dehydrogenase